MLDAMVWANPRRWVALLWLWLLVSPVAAQDLTVATWNLKFFNDHDIRDDKSQIGPSKAPPTEAHYRQRLHGVAAAMEQLEADVIALQEVENRRVLEDLAAVLRTRGLLYRVAFRQGTDTYTGQDVGFLVRDGISFAVRRYRFEPGVMPKGQYKDVSKHARLEVRHKGRAAVLVNVHLSTRSRDRMRQARTLSWWLEREKTAALVVLGDLNTGLRVDRTTPNSDVGLLRRLANDCPGDDLVDALALVPDAATHLSGRHLDRVLIASPLQASRVEVRRDLAVLGSPDPAGMGWQLDVTERDLSDHYPVKVTLIPTGRSPSCNA